jgi:hypothetical protein
MQRRQRMKVCTAHITIVEYDEEAESYRPERFKCNYCQYRRVNLLKGWIDPASLESMSCAIIIATQDQIAPGLVVRRHMNANKYSTVLCTAPSSMVIFRGGEKMTLLFSQRPIDKSSPRCRRVVGIPQATGARLHAYKGKLSSSGNTHSYTVGKRTCFDTIAGGCRETASRLHAGIVTGSKLSCSGSLFLSQARTMCDILQCARSKAVNH